ncbi:MAG: ParB/RepB/Spo0J family partition protein [Thermodesulfovibrionales bacterium]|nr:ParB/RepB/Spo0J family partition protein [Thermodesulfovibrionales bacterium]
MALGRGLDALIPKKQEEIAEIDIERVQPGHGQPRKIFRDEALRELAASIKEKGVLQPILVSREEGGVFRLIAGERRLRASRLAGKGKIPAIIRSTTPEDSLEVALIENIQRENLGPMETANAFHRLMKEFKLTQEELSAKVGKERATVANYLRLLKLPDEIKELINEDKLSMGHARALLSIEGRQAQIKAAGAILGKGLSVREAEALAKRLSPGQEHPQGKAAALSKDPQIASLEQKLIKSLATKVRIHASGKKGRIEIEYYSLDELDRLLDILTA